MSQSVKSWRFQLAELDVRAAINKWSLSIKHTVVKTVFCLVFWSEWRWDSFRAFELNCEYSLSTRGPFGG